MFKEILITDRKENRGGLRSLIHGVGVNDAPYQTSIKVSGTRYTCPYYMRWRCMMDRCYSKQWAAKHPTYATCYVEPIWHSFMAFKNWMLAQNWYEKQLDKDLLSLGNKRYSPETCLFVSRQVNSLFNEREYSRGELPLGIYARHNKYEVGVSRGAGKRSWVGAYATIPEAIDAYVQAKADVATRVAQQEPDPLVKAAVENYSKYFTEKLLLLKAGY